MVRGSLDCFLEDIVIPMWQSSGLEQVVGVQRYLKHVSAEVC